jgi:hypothetical protein
MRRTPAGIRWGAAACWFAVVGACGADEEGPIDRGPVEGTLEQADRVAWPGLDTAEGRVVPFVRNFANGRPTGYWFFGMDRRRTADVFWFCREGDDGCPLDEHRRLDWDRVIGQPLFSRIPGDSQYSHYWMVWVVWVPETFEPDSVTTIGTLFDEDALDRVRVEALVLDFAERGPQETIMHLPMVLAGTELEDNGGPMPDGSGDMIRVERHWGWRQGYRVHFFDFTPLEGVFPEAEDSESRPLMPTANIYVLWRSCEEDPRPAICDLPGHAFPDRRPVSERGLGQDVTGDGDTRDTNNVVGALQCEEGEPTEPAYSPAWAVWAVDVLDGTGLALIDTTGDERVSDVTSATRLRELVEAAVLSEPVPQGFDSTGSPLEEGDQALFNCPHPVPEGFVPFPCPARSPGPAGGASRAR